MSEKNGKTCFLNSFFILNFLFYFNNLASSAMSIRPPKFLAVLLLYTASVLYGGSYGSQGMLPFLEGYSKTTRPLAFNEEEATHVKVWFSVVSFGPVAHYDMTVTTELYLRSMWVDPSLKCKISFSVGVS